MVTFAVLWWLAAQNAALPDGPGAAIVQSRCIICHETDLIRSQRLSRAGWGREIDKMIRWGAQVPDADREPLLTYLAAFGPAPVKTAPASAAGETVYKAACLICHEADLIQQQRLSRAGWLRTVDKMIRWGAPVPAADREALADWLAAR